MYNLGNTYYVQNNYFQSALQFEKAIELDQSNSEWRCYVAGLYIEKGDFERAKVHLDSVIRIDPNH